jgi:GT2 family glycosyltransferase
VERISVTVIITVIHSLEDLSRCLKSLNRLDYPKDLYQVAILDCRVVYGLSDFLSEYLPKQNYNVNVLQLPEKPLKGPRWLIEQRTNEACNHAIKMMPAQLYVFSEDDCTFEPDWLKRYVHALTDEVGALGGPDILPNGLGWFPKSLDFVLNSFFGTAGIRGTSTHASDHYYPRKQNMAVPARVIKQVGGFPQDILVGGELHLTKRIRAAGFKVQFLPDNPVIHRRTTTYINFFRLNAYRATANVKSLRKQKAFTSSLHFLVFLTFLIFVLLGPLSLFSVYLRVLLTTFVVMYGIALVISGFISTIRTHSISTGLGVLLLMPTHHISLAIGTFYGAVKRVDSSY